MLSLIHCGRDAAGTGMRGLKCGLGDWVYLTATLPLPGIRCHAWGWVPSLALPAWGLKRVSSVTGQCDVGDLTDHVTDHLTDASLATSLKPCLPTV